MGTDSVIIRGYENSDKEKCRVLWRELTEHHREIYHDSSIGGEDPGILFDGHLKRIGPGRIWVAEKEGKIVGMVGLIVHGEEAEIEPVIVRSEERQKGTGKMLLDFVIQKARKTDVKFLTIKPVMRNFDAIKLFHRMGVQNVGHIELFMDLRKKKGKWKPGLELWGLQFNY